jgi:DNA-binding NarL/FixJ family response regulator
MVALLGVMTAVQAWGLWKLMRLTRALAPLDERVSSLNRAVSMLTDTTESGFDAIGRQLARKPAPVAAPPKVTAVRQARQRRVVTAARKGKSVPQIAAAESMSEGEVALRLDVARELPRKSKH